MEDSRRRSCLRVFLLCALVFLAFAERRLAELDFDSTGVVRIENNDKPDGDEIINRLVFVDDAKEPVVSTVGDACQAALIPVDSCPRSLITVQLSETRAPPLARPSHV